MSCSNSPNSKSESLYVVPASCFKSLVIAKSERLGDTNHIFILTIQKTLCIILQEWRHWSPLALAHWPPFFPPVKMY